METIWIEAKAWKGHRDLKAICDRIEHEQHELQIMLNHIALVEHLASPHLAIFVSGFLAALLKGL